MTGTSILTNVTSGVRLALEVAWGADLTDLDGSGWTWSDITADVQLTNGWGVDIQIGRADESTITQPATLTATLDNTAGAYSQGGQNTTNYPNVRIGTPVRVRISTDSGSNWTVKFQGNAAGWTPQWDTTGKWATVMLTASGPLRQLNQGTLGATSYYAQTIPTLTGAGQLFEGLQYYWNNENGNGSAGPYGTVACYPTYPTGVVSTTDVRTLTAVSAYIPKSPPTSNTTAFPVSGPIPSNWDFATGTPLTGSSTGKLTFRWMVGFTSVSSNEPIIYWRTSASGSLLWAIYVNSSGGLWVQNGTDPAASNGYVGTGVTFNANGNAWYMQLQMSTNGAGSTIRLDDMDFNGNNAGFTWNATGSTTGYLTYVNFVGPGNQDDNAFMEAHMTVQNITPGIPAGLASFFKGNPGELVTDRLTRIANANNIPITIFTSGTTETSTNKADFMGSQFYDTTANLLRECEATGAGLLFDGFGIGLTYMHRTLLQSQQPAMTVDATQNAVVMPFAPQFDDQGIVNQATVTRRNGASYTYTDTTSANLIGVYPTTVNINQLDDGGLPRMAQWTAALGASSGYRYPSWTFYLEKKPSLIANWLTCIPGCRVDVSNISSTRTQHPTGTIRNSLQGWHEQISQHQWHVQANTTSYEKHKVVTLAAATGTTTDTLGRYESDGSTVTSNVSAGGTSISVTTSSGPKWTTSGVTADDFPLVVNINGNPITVTAISSTTSPQTFTVSAVPYAIAAGSAVTVWQNAVLGL